MSSNPKAVQILIFFKINIIVLYGLYDKIDYVCHEYYTLYELTNNDK